MILIDMNQISVASLMMHLHMNRSKLEEDMDNLKVETVNKSISKAIMDARMKLNLKQKDVANKINVQPQVVQFLRL